ncbi:MAG: methylated-DNA--[protein]-cysteine S-methyltransferase [Dehalococcoidia bacterium]|nr:methylated-DNA--[protein]-cysteine S-methyltransferase [Dehalococcoidia bacterium]
MAAQYSALARAALAPLFRNEEEALIGAHARLEREADTAGLLDVAYRVMPTHIGPLLLAATDVGLVHVAFAGGREDRVLAEIARTVSPRVLRAPARLDRAADEVDAYLGGRRRSFDLPLDLRLVRGFRRSVLDFLAAIPYGATASYGALAAATGHPGAARAVGSACAANPLPIVLPCHRVVRGDGSPGSYAGGAEVKRALLALEQRGQP